MPGRLITQPCLSAQCSPIPVLNNMKHLMCRGGFLYRPGTSLLHTSGSLSGSATIYGSDRPYRREENGSQANGVPFGALGHLAGQHREIFYKLGKNICYAGTFEASPTIGIFGIAQYRTLSRATRRRIVNSVIPEGLNEKDRGDAIQKLWSGESEINIQYLEWKRIGFNMKLFDALRSQLPEPSEDTKGQQTIGSKRKVSQQDNGPVLKRTKTHKK
ncbi:hypothetical protein BC629DRAFT_1543595 [Irpex lacteus]|nr:hypothetical protein BC629DRAFT_1543595 [Irpex lacteus]